MVRTYLHEIGRIPLLNSQQEIDFGNQVQQMMNLLTAKEKLNCSIKPSNRHKKNGLKI